MIFFTVYIATIFLFSLLLCSIGDIMLDDLFLITIPQGKFLPSKFHHTIE